MRAIQRIQHVLKRPIDSPYRWGNSLSKSGEVSSALMILELVQHLPRGSMGGTPYNFNYAFDEWLKSFHPIAHDHVVHRRSSPNESAKEQLGRYLIDCLPMTQSADDRWVTRASDWEGIARQVKRARFHNAGYVPQHRTALAMRGIVFGKSQPHLGDICKCLVELTSAEYVHTILHETISSDAFLAMLDCDSDAES